MYRRQQTESDWGFLGDVAKIALGVFIGSMAAIFAYEGVLAWRGVVAQMPVAAEVGSGDERDELGSG